MTEEERQAVKKVVDLANNGDQGAQKIIDMVKDNAKRQTL